VHSLLRGAIAATTLACGLAAHAGTVKFEGWAHGGGNTVNVSSPGFNGQAGGFSVTLANFTGPNALNGAFEAYCVDLYEHIRIGDTYDNYTIMSASVVFGAAKAEALQQLISYVNGSALFANTVAGSKDNQSTALQLAIWNIVYDTDKTLTQHVGAAFSELAAIGGGSYRNTTGAIMGANDLLNATPTAGFPSYQLFVLKSDNPNGRQDQLIWRLNPVSAPGSLALVALAAGLAVAVRRRRG
jgi:hypothetical protein